MQMQTSCRLTVKKILTGKLYSSKVTALENSRKKWFLKFKDLCKEMFSILLQFHRTISQSSKKIGGGKCRATFQRIKTFLSINIFRKQESPTVVSDNRAFLLHNISVRVWTNDVRLTTNIVAQTRRRFNPTRELNVRDLRPFAKYCPLRLRFSLIRYGEQKMKRKEM